jgi:hypothetical protein
MSERSGWRMTLRCGCVWRLDSAPDLTRPWCCGVDDHGFQSVMKAERTGDA